MGHGRKTGAIESSVMTDEPLSVQSSFGRPSTVPSRKITLPISAALAINRPNVASNSPAPSPNPGHGAWLAPDSPTARIATMQSSEAS
jgi:hypothetical protein